MGYAVFALIIQEKNFKKFPKNRIFYEAVNTEGIAFSLYRLTYNNKRFFKKALRLKNKLTLPTFIAGDTLPKELTETYAKLLELNLFLEITRQKKIKTATLCDPKGQLCFKIGDAVKSLGQIKILTENTAAYEEYCDSLLSVFGTCPIVCQSKGENDISYRFKAKGNGFTLGRGGFRADISSVFCPEALRLCPEGVSKEQFFTLAALYCRFQPLLSAVPQGLVSNEITLYVNSIF